MNKEILSATYKAIGRSVANYAATVLSSEPVEPSEENYKPDITNQNYYFNSDLLAKQYLLRFHRREDPPCYHLTELEAQSNEACQKTLLIYDGGSKITIEIN